MSVQIGVLTGGGDCPGLNAAIRAVVRKASTLGWTVLGFRDGWAGVVQRQAAPLTVETTDAALAVGGTLLGSSRTNPLRSADDYARVLGVFDELQLDGLVAIGGDDTLSVAGALAADRQPVVGIPKTIDNDVPETEACIGFDTAVHTIVDAIARLRTTTTSHHRVTVVETMGRAAGWLAALGGIAAGADLIAVPERATPLEHVVRHVRRRRERGVDFSIIVVAEGAEVTGLDLEDAAVQTTDQFGHVQLSTRSLAEALARALEDATGIEARASVLGHLQRGGVPTPFDRVVATRYGVSAVNFLAGGDFGMMTALRSGQIAAVPLTDIAGKTRDLDGSYLDLLTLFG